MYEPIGPSAVQGAGTYLPIKRHRGKRHLGTSTPFHECWSAGKHETADQHKEYPFL